MQTRMAFHHKSTIMNSMGLPNRVCMICLLPECSEEDRLCLRAYMTGSRSAKADVAVMLKTVDAKLAAKLKEGRKGFDVAVMCEARDRLRAAAGDLDHA